MLILSALLAAAPLAQDAPKDTTWGRFRGPDGTGHAAGTLPTDLEVEWSADVPAGYSSPVVHDSRVFLTGADKTHLWAICIDEATGERLWHRKVEYDGKRPGANSSAAPTPAVDAERVYTLFHHHGLIAFDHYGEEVWRNPLGAPFNIPHGLGTSPIVHGGHVFVQLDQDAGSALVCLDAENGTEVWRTARDRAAHSYSTPTVHVREDGRTILIVSGSYEIAGYDAKDGSRVWWVEGAAWQTKSVPLIHEGHCLVNAYMPPSGEFGVPQLPPTFEAALERYDEDESGEIDRPEWDHDMMQQTWFIWDRDGNDSLNADEYTYLQSTKTDTGALFAIRLGGEGNVTDTHVAWTFDQRRYLSDLITPVIVDGRLYALKDVGVMTCIDASTGEKQSDERVSEPDQYFASPIAAGSRIMTLGGSGLVSIVQCGEEWETIASVELEAGRTWATPALSDERILVRGTSKLVSIKR